MNASAPTRTIVLIHGAWLNSLSSEMVNERYEAQGHTVIATDWPFDDRSPEDLRASPSTGLTKLGQREIVDHYERIIRALPEAPIRIGQSLGGVFV